MSDAETLDAMLARLLACDDARVWSKDKSLAEAWATCERADWMCWLLVRLHPYTAGQVRLALCACAETALQYIPAGEDRPRRAIEVARLYARGQATDQQLAAAGHAAGAAAWAAAGHAARDVAWDAAGHAAGAAAGDAALRDMAQIVRRLIPDPEHLPRIEDMP